MPQGSRDAGDAGHPEAGRRDAAQPRRQGPARPRGGGGDRGAALRPHASRSTARAGEGGRLFGSVTATDIADAVAGAARRRDRPAPDRARRAAQGARRRRAGGSPAPRRHRDGARSRSTAEPDAARRPGTVPSFVHNGRPHAVGARARRAHPRLWRTRPSQSPWLWIRGRVVHRKDTGLFLFQPTGSRCEPATAAGRAGTVPWTIRSTSARRRQRQWSIARRASRLGPHAADARATGRIPPHNLEAEESLLGAMMLSREALTAAVEAHIEARDFYKPAHGVIFDAAFVLHSRGEPVDPVTVVGGAAAQRAARRARRPADAAAHPGRDAGVGERRALRADRRRALDAAAAHRDRGRHPADGVRRSTTTSTRRSTAPSR